MGVTRILRRLALASVLLGGICLAPGLAPPPALAQSTTAPAPAAPAPAPTPAPALPPATPAAPAPSAPLPVTPPPAPSAPAPKDAPSPAPAKKPDAADKASPDTSISQTFELQPHSVIQFSGQSTWDDGFKTLNDAFTRLNESLSKIGMKPHGNPTALFTETDDAGFKFTAMIPVETAPDGKPDLPSDVSFAMSPSGKVMKFQHRSAYDDIDSTYEAITAYLDEKGLESKNMFAEEYLNRTKAPDDPALEVDILVFLK